MLQSPGAGATEMSPLLPKMPPDAEGDPLLLLSSTIQSPVGGTELEAWGGVTLRQARVSKDGSEGKQANTTSGRRLPQVTSCSGPWFCPVQKGDNTPSHGSTEMAQGECPARPGPGSQSPSGLGGGGGELSGSCWCCPPPRGGGLFQKPQVRFEDRRAWKWGLALQPCPLSCHLPCVCRWPRGGPAL